MNKCICFKTPLEGPPVRLEKGDTFTYFLNYDDNEGFGPPVKVELYDVNTGRHRFSIGKITFDEYFVDIIEFREEQIDKILE
jgi:hypothetical protein